jgi:hypothetical protein
MTGQILDLYQPRVMIWLNKLLSHLVQEQTRNKVEVEVEGVLGFFG